MRTTIDSAGRIVIPKSLRDASGLLAGEVEVNLVGASVVIEPVSIGELTHEDGLLLLPATGAPLTTDDVREIRLADQR